MEKQPFIIGKKILWILVLSNILLLLIGVLYKIQHWTYSAEILAVGLMLLLISWLLIIRDLFLFPQKYLVFWIIGLLIFPSITSILYLIYREKHIPRTPVFNPQFTRVNN